MKIFFARGRDWEKRSLKCGYCFVRKFQIEASIHFSPIGGSKSENFCSKIFVEVFLKKKTMFFVLFF